MADGQGGRWKNYLGHPKHLLKIDGETLLERTVRLLRQYDPLCDVLITSHDVRYEVEGAVRYEPQNNILEIDRFTYELIKPNTTFLYGDTFYSDNAISCIVDMEATDLLFFGNKKAIIAIKINDADTMKHHIDKIRELCQVGDITEGKGWQVYQSFSGMSIGGEKVIANNYIIIDDVTCDFNSPDDLRLFHK